MGLFHAVYSPTQSPLKSLFTLHIVRTLSLVSFAVFSSFLYTNDSPYGYDTSTSLLITKSDDETSASQNAILDSSLRRLSIALTRWDALYFVTAGRRGGYVFEQEWAFAPGLGAVVRALEVAFLKLFSATNISELNLSSWALATAWVSFAAHFLSSLVLYQLVRTIFRPRNEMYSSKNELPNKLNILQDVNTLAFTAVTLHILAPAGIFLSSPYNESLFSLLSFLGYWSYCSALANQSENVLYGLRMLLAGSCFGLSCLVRSNGILNGTLFLIELAVNVQMLLQGKNLAQSIYRCAFIGLAGVLAGTGTIYLQYEGWRTYCQGGETREWCLKTLPSIYTFVQEHYWNVGFLRYWRIPNLPLFLLVSPVMSTLIYTSISTLIAKDLTDVSHGFRSFVVKQGQQSVTMVDNTTAVELLQRLAIPQLLLSLLSITNYHVQVLTRLSSGLVLWYIIVAAQLKTEALWSKENSRKEKEKNRSVPARSQWQWGSAIVRWNVGYAIVQSVLYGGFLPPA